MNVWILNHYAGPPETTPATRTFDLSKELVRMGHSVTIFACSFNHYTFAEEQLKPGQLYRFTELQGVRFVWIRGVPYKDNGWLRFFNMLVFAWLAFLIGLWLKPRPDIVIGTSVHLLTPASAFLISRVRGSRFWFDITDIWPQSLVELGHLQADSPITKVFGLLENFALSRAELVMSVLPNIAEYVRDKGFADRPTAWIPNGIDQARAALVPQLESSNGKVFTVAWAGGFAPAHALEIILEAAAIVQADSTPIHFVLIGDGPEMNRVKTLIKKLGLTNVELTGFIPKHQLYNQLAQADGFLVTGRNLPVYRYGISYNKIFDYLLVGRPVIFAINSHNNPIAEAGAGLSVPAEDPKALAQAVIQLYEMPLPTKQNMGKQAQQFVLNEFDYTVIAKHLANHFNLNNRDTMEARKQKEIEFHNKVRDMALREDQEAYSYFWSNQKFYSITRKSTKFYENWLLQRRQNKKVLDYCCGDGIISIPLAQQGFDVTGIDISDVSIENCRRAANEEGVADRAAFHVMDAENLEFEDDTFDLIVCSGVLHHLDLNQAFPELARVLKPEGEIICIEPLAYNPLIQLYRKRTPQLRTEWEAEHILTMHDLDLARNFFGRVEVKFFHLATLGAVPFRNTPWFDTILSWLEMVDEVILSLPFIQTQAWQMIFTLSQPSQVSQQESFVARHKQTQKKLLLGALVLVSSIGGMLAYTRLHRNGPENTR